MLNSRLRFGIDWSNLVINPTMQLIRNRSAQMSRPVSSWADAALASRKTKHRAYPRLGKRQYPLSWYSNLQYLPCVCIIDTEMSPWKEKEGEAREFWHQAWRAPLTASRSEGVVLPPVGAVRWRCSRQLILYLNEKSFWDLTISEAFFILAADADQAHYVITIADTLIRMFVRKWGIKCLT